MTAAIQLQDDGTRAVIAVDGEIDLATSPDLDSLIAGLTTAEIVLQLAGVTFMGSSGLASLLRASRKAEELGGQLVIRAPSRQVRDLLEMTRLTDRFTIED